MSWQVQEAKNRFSELIETVLKQGPQVITRHHQEVVVVVPIKQFKKLNKQKKPLSQFFRNSPLVDLNLARSQDKRLREVSL